MMVACLLFSRVRMTFARGWSAGVEAGLGWPCVAFVSRITPAGDALELRRELEDGYQTIRTNGPTVVTATNDETNVLRFAKVRDVMASSRKPIANWNAAKLGVDLASLPELSTELLDLFVPEGTRHAEIIDGDTPSEKARSLARRLRELSVL